MEAALIQWSCSLPVLRRLVGKNRRQFEIHETEATVRLAIRHVSRVWIVVVHAVRFKFREQLLQSFVIDPFHARPTTGRDYSHFDRVGFEQARDKFAPLLLEISKHLNLMIETLARIGAVIGLHDPAIEGQVHGLARRVFNFQHLASLTTNRHE